MSIMASSGSGSTPELIKLIKPWKLDYQETYVFYNANIVDTFEGKVLPNATIKTTGGKILYVKTNDALTANIPDTTDAHDTKSISIDLEGRYVCPGLIDCHVHIAVVPGELDIKSYLAMSERVSLLRQPQVLRSMLSRGFTTVRDCGGATLAMKQAIEDGVHTGPRLFIAGRALSQTGGHGDMRNPHEHGGCSCGSISGISRVVDGAPECLRSARDELRQGADFIKIMGSGGVTSPTDQIEHLQFSDEEIKAIVTAAKNAGTYVTSHSYTPQSIRQAIKQGVRGIEHGNLIDEETAKLMAETGTFLTPTLAAHVMAKSLNFLPPKLAAKNEEVLERGLSALKIATDAGVTVCFGTDLFGPMHFAQTKEFSIRKQVQTPLQILRSATVNAAKLLMQENWLGQVKKGFAADLLIMTGNPLDDITLLDSGEDGVLAVMKDGRFAVSRWDRLEAKA